jgi:hypothetical protein
MTSNERAYILFLVSCLLTASGWPEKLTLLEAAEEPDWSDDYQDIITELSEYAADYNKFKLISRLKEIKEDLENETDG